MSRVLNRFQDRFKFWPLAFIAASVVVIDQWQKFYVFHHLLPNQTVPLLSGGRSLGHFWLSLCRYPNSGGIFQSHELVFNPGNSWFVRYLPTASLILYPFIYNGSGGDRFGLGVAGRTPTWVWSFFGRGAFPIF